MPIRIVSMATLFALVFVLLFSVFVVDQREKAILFQLGEIVRADLQPGIHFKVPFVNNVRRFDGRVQTLDAEPERYLTSEKKNVIVDSFVKWKINQVNLYYTTMGGDKRRANLRLSQIIKDGLRGAFGKRTIQDVVSGDRQEIMTLITKQANTEAAQFGIEVVDVRIKRVDLSRDVSNSVYRRMESERHRVAKELRSKGAEAAERIRADADRQRTVILAEAYREAERIRGEGDSKSADIYANAYNKNSEFYAFYRSLNAYKSSFNQPGDLLLLDPKSDFFKYFGSSSGVGR
jgi:modulator of FtsH protease HflC